jgi:thioredoxin-like negative regulator of GroEL
MEILKFYSDTCGPCKVLSKRIKEAEIKVKEVNIEDDDDLINKYKIRSVPTLVKIDNGVEIGRFTGVMTVDQLKTWCK